MSLSRKFKQAFVRHYNHDGGWLLIPVFLSGGLGAYGAGSALYDAPSETPLAPLTQEAAAREKAILGQHLNLVGKSYKEYSEINEVLQKAEGDLAQAEDVTAARDKLAKLTMDKLEARFALDDETQKFHHFVLQKTALSEATVEATIGAYAVQWDLPAKVTMSYKYRDEIRAGFDPTGLGATAATQKMYALESSAESHARLGVGALGLIGLFGGIISSYLAFGLGGQKLKNHFRHSLRREEREEENRRRELQKIDDEKRRQSTTALTAPEKQAQEKSAPAPAEPPQKSNQFRL